MKKIAARKKFLAIGAKATGLGHPPPLPVWYSKPAFEDRVEAVDMDGAHVRIYSIDRTLADWLKYKNEIGIDVCIQMLHRYRICERMKLEKLEHYAKLCCVERVMRPSVEPIL